MAEGPPPSPPTHTPPSPRMRAGLPRGVMGVVVPERGMGGRGVEDHLGGGSGRGNPSGMEPGKRNADLQEWDAKIRKLTEEFEECDTENDELAAEIDNLTAELEERERKISECDAKIRDRDSRLRKLTAELGNCTKKLQQREAELGRLRELLEEKDSEIRQKDAVVHESSEELEESEPEEDELSEELDEITEDLAKQSTRIDELTAELDELSAEIEKRDRKIDDLTVELEEYKAKMRKCLEEHRKSEEKMADVTLDPATAHPRLVLSRDLKSVRWEYLLRELPTEPGRFEADPCVLGSEAFVSGRHFWVVDVARGQYCALGVSKESLGRKRPVAFKPQEGIWGLQQWGFQTRALTDPPTPLDLPRVPKKIRICLDYDWGEVAFFDAEKESLIFTFSPVSFGGERIRPWFWVELGTLSLVP
ncbi:uncharacterized protein [Numenius arquata]|uniref:uncharacterized protein n=1 Tax=Numenius arquata TaxID=31919 RepID=UPI003D303F3A